MRYAELHCKTNFSFLEGASHPDELVRRAAELSYRALAVTDRNSLAGVVRAHIAAKEVGLPLVIGAEITPIDAPPVVLWATDRASYGRLCRLITRGRRQAPKGECALSIEDVAEFAAGLIAGVQPPRAPGDRFSRVPGRPGVVDPEHGIVDSGEDIESRIKARFDAIEKHLKQIATEKDGLFQGLSIGKLLVGALGLSGPLAAAVIIAGGLAGRRVKKRIANDAKVESTANGAHWPERQRPIAVDTPPPPQRTVPETHYVSVEKDSFAKAHQWACEQVARKYPGATEILQAQDSLIKQHLAAQ